MGFEQQLQPVWLARDSERIWRGSYKNKAWKHLVGLCYITVAHVLRVGMMQQLIITLLCVMHYIRNTGSPDCCAVWQTFSAPKDCMPALHLERYILHEPKFVWLLTSALKLNDMCMSAAQHSYMGRGGGSKEG